MRLNRRDKGIANLPKAMRARRYQGEDDVQAQAVPAALNRVDGRAVDANARRGLTRRTKEGKE
jgi:hypothetical protein